MRLFEAAWLGELPLAPSVFQWPDLPIPSRDFSPGPVILAGRPEGQGFSPAEDAAS
jgi:hypothetical protein